MTRCPLSSGMRSRSGTGTGCQEPPRQTSNGLVQPNDSASDFHYPFVPGNTTRGRTSFVQGPGCRTSSLGRHTVTAVLRISITGLCMTSICLFRRVPCSPSTVASTSCSSAGALSTRNLSSRIAHLVPRKFTTLMSFKCSTAQDEVGH
jgi:hypothetical protein